MRKLLIASSLLGVIIIGCGENGDDESPVSPNGDIQQNDVDPMDNADAEGLADGSRTSEDSDGETTPTDAGGQSVTYTQDKLGLGEEFVLRGVWGANNNKLAAVGNKATILEYDGSSWAVVHQNTQLDTLNGVWGSSFDDIWAVGAKGAIVHKGPDGWNVGTGCTSDAACNDNDPCTIDICSTDGQCIYEGTGGANCCGSTFYSQSFEAGIAGWTVEDLEGTGMLWQAAAVVSNGTPRATDGMYSLYFGDPNKLCTGSTELVCPNFNNGLIVSAQVTSPSIAVPDAESVTATFDVFIDSESSSYYDQLEFRVLADGEESTVWAKADVGGTTGKSFVSASADLSEFAGQTIQIRYWFDSLDSGANSGEGVYIDNLALNTTCGALGTRFPTLWDVSGLAEDDVYAVGNQGTIIHWDGISWKLQSGGNASDLYGVSGNNQLVVAGGANGEVFSNIGGGLATDIAGVNAIRVVAVLNDDSAIGVGDSGAIVTFDGIGWASEPSGVFANLNGAWTDGSTVVAVGEQGQVIFRNGATWSANSPGTASTLYGAWGTAADNVWVCGDKGTLYHYNGGTWVNQTLNTISNELRSMMGDGPAGPYVVVGGKGTIAEFDGATWKKLKSPTTFVLHDVWGQSTNTAWAVGNLGTIIRRVNGVWDSAESPTSATLYGIWGRSSDDIYAVGAAGTTLRWDGSKWSVLRSSTPNALRAVWGRSPSDVFAVGARATIMRFNGLYWSQVVVEDQLIGGEPQPVTDLLLDVWATDADNVYAIGAGGAIIRTVPDEVTGDVVWEKLPQENTITMRGIWGNTDGDMWMVGREGTVMAFDGQTVSVEPTNSIATLYGVIGFGANQVVAVGDLGTVLRRTIGQAE
ncbi:MAG: hypothetical protein VX223_12585 [Myxococcota bacterium]|nr:hypothetical protein [Myxococcota bacterium]